MGAVQKYFFGKVWISDQLKGAEGWIIRSPNLDLSKNAMKHTLQKRMNGANFFAGISETVGVQQGRDGRSVFIFISSTFFSISRFFHLYFSLTSWLIFCYRNVLEDSFLTNTIPEFDPTPPRVRLSIVLEIKHNLMR